MSKSNCQEIKHIVKVTNIEGRKGILYLGWFNDASAFRMNENALYKSKTIVQNQNEVMVVFKNIPKGKYAIAVFLNENNNNLLDKNFLGIPKEKYGFSNNIVPLTRPARFSESSFYLKDSDTIINITLK
jgi:uncharacterized protein (DUF2141 family)